ncbi:MAG: YabP/YqfC family sporulation protein [Oscillospiraceae bacterium]
MPYEDKKAALQRRPHAVTLDERSHLTVTGVDEVVRFDDTEVSMRTSRGMLTVHGRGCASAALRSTRGSWPSTARLTRSTTREETASGGGFLVAPVRRMSLHPLAQLGQVALALGLGAALGLLFDVLRVPRRHARQAFLRAVLDAVFCPGGGADGVRLRHGGRLGAGAPVHVSRHRGRLDGLLCLGQRTGFAAAGAIFPPLRAKNAPICRPRTEICKKVWIFAKNASKIAADVLE